MEFDSEARAADESDQFCVLCPLVKVLGLVIEVAAVAHFDDVDCEPVTVCIDVLPDCVVR